MPQTAVKGQDITLEEKAFSYQDRAKQLTISSSQDYTAAGEFVKSVDGLIKEVEGSFKPLIEKAHMTHKAMIAEMNRHLTPLQTAKTLTRGLMISWDKIQEQKRREEEVRLQKIARELEIERQLQEAIAAEANGDQAEAQAIIDEPVFVPPVILQKTTPKIQGVQFRTVWKFRVVDESKIPRELMIPDLVKIGQMVRALKGSVKIAGVEAYEDRV